MTTLQDNDRAEEGSPGRRVDAGTNPGDLDPIQQLAAVIFRDPKGQYLDFAVYRSRLSKVTKRKAWPKKFLLLLRAVLEFEATHRKLPTKTELLDTHQTDVDMVGLVEPIGEVPSDLTLDYVCQRIIARARLLDDLRTAEAWAKKLKESKNVEKGRAYLKAQFGESITAIEVRANTGTVQDHAGDIYERFRKMAEADTSDANPLRFKTMFPTIDGAINTELERCFALVGPPNNFKTSVLLSEVYNLAKQGFPVLLVTGEHDVHVLEEFIALLHGHHCRDRFRFRLPAYKNWRDGKVKDEDLQNLSVVLEDLNALVSCPGPVVIKHVNEFSNDLGEVLLYMENSELKYEWKCLVIDPFDTLLLNTPSEQRFFKGGELIQRLFDLKTSYAGGRGLIVLTSLQMKKGVKGQVEKLQNDPTCSISDFEEVLDASQVAVHSAAVEKFDMMWAVSGRNRLGSQGVLVCARARFSKPFESFWFQVDPESHYCYEKPKALAAMYEEAPSVDPEEALPL